MYLFKNVNISWSVGLTLKPKHQAFEQKIISTFNIGNTVVTLTAELFFYPQHPAATIKMVSVRSSVWRTNINQMLLLINACSNV